MSRWVKATSGRQDRRGTVAEQIASSWALLAGRHGAAADRQGDDEGDQVVLARRGAVKPEPPQHRLQQRHDRRLGDGAQSEAGEGDAELAGGQVQVQLLLDLQPEAREEAALVRLRLQPAGPRPDRREFRGHEIPVQGHEP